MLVLNMTKLAVKNESDRLDWIYFKTKFEWENVVKIVPFVSHFPPFHVKLQNWFHGNKIKVVGLWHALMESFVETAPVKNREATLYCGPTNGIGCVRGRQVDICHLQREERGTL